MCFGIDLRAVCYNPVRFKVLEVRLFQLNGKQVLSLCCPRNGKQVWVRRNATVRKHGKAMHQDL
jgi:hypothetical protein